jgi:5'-deoxynucleotidase YfbR-like HD superfamily hydrolase/biotin operon repressor
MLGMQPIDPADKRQPNVQIAASIRAAILTGELEPGSQLPPGHELARFFGVSRMTVQTALRTLREEGFVRSRTGSGVYVRDQASLPAPAQQDHPLDGMAAFLFEMGHLKQLPRAGWLLLGIPQPETVAEHSFRVGVTGTVLAALEGADVGRTAALCLLHDVHETRIGDVPSVGRAYVTTAAPEAVVAHQTSAMPEGAAKAVQDLVAEYEAGETPESRVARDADKIETLIQAVEYQAQGHDTAAWQGSSVAALRTDAGRQLAAAITSADPRGWWSAFAASYRELRASSQRRGRKRQTGGATAEPPPGDARP